MKVTLKIFNKLLEKTRFVFLQKYCLKNNSTTTTFYNQMCSVSQSQLFIYQKNYTKRNTFKQGLIHSITSVSFSNSCTFFPYKNMPSFQRFSDSSPKTTVKVFEMRLVPATYFSVFQFRHLTKQNVQKLLCPRVLITYVPQYQKKHKC